MTQRKKLIEVALPLEAINDASGAEKANPFIKSHPRKLHLWWARRPLAATRAVIFTSLVDDPDDSNAPPAFVQACRELPKGKNATTNDTPRQRLFDFIERLVTWEATTDEAILTTARALIQLSTNGNPPPLLDPFAGGGSIPLEAQRLGLEAHASDLNPVAVMINKALIEIPPKFANQPPMNPRDRAKVGGTSEWKGASGLAADVRYYGEWVQNKAQERIGHLYPRCDGETVIAWLWARTVKCPNPACGAQMPLVSSFELSKKKGNQTWVEPQIDRQKRTVTLTVKSGKGKVPTSPKQGRGAKFKCLVCGEVAPDQHLKDEGVAGRMGTQLMAIVTEGNNGQNFHSPTLEHQQVSNTLSPSWQPLGELPEDPRNIWCKSYGLVEFADLFTTRQLVALTTFSDLIAKASEQVLADAQAVGLSNSHLIQEHAQNNITYSEAISVYLSFALSRLTDYSTTICTWNKSNENIRNAFARQAIPMTWDFAEANLFGEKLSFRDACEWIAPVLDDLKVNQVGIAFQQDAASLRSKQHFLISTDPPYYDNISYADLADFFYTWLRSCLKNSFPDIFGTLLAPKTPELIASPYRFNGDSKAAESHFETGLIKAFSHIHSTLIPEYPFTVYYAFKQEEMIIGEGVASTGWEKMLNGLIESGLSIVGTWPMRTERSVRTISLGTNALASSIVLVCRSRPENAPLTSRREFVNSLRRELPAALREMQSGNIAPVDLAQASIGPGMAVYSRYSQVLEPDGSRLTVRAALQLINQVLDEYLAEAEGDLDSDSRFAVSWFEQYGFNSGEFGIADVLARAKNTSVDGLVNAGVIEAGAGKVRLLTWEELDPGWNPAEDNRPTVWEATHHLIERLNVHGEEGAALLLAKMSPDLAADARQLAYRLYAICERKGWADHARDYNALVISWSTSQERAAAVKQTYQQRSLFA